MRRTLISFVKTQVIAEDGVTLPPPLFPHSCNCPSIVALHIHLNTNILSLVYESKMASFEGDENEPTILLGHLNM